MPRNKSRLQLALYVRPKHPGTYHYALFVSPKPTGRAHGNTATKYHVKNTLQQDSSGELAQPWRYEKTDIQDVNQEHRLLVRVVIAKVTSTDALEKALEAVPIYQVNNMDQVKAKDFNCRTWVRTALEELKKESIVAGLGDWDSLHRQAVEYLEKKLEVERWSAKWPGQAGVPMLDLLNGREIFE